MVAFSKFSMISQIIFISSNNNNKNLIDDIFKDRTQLLDDCWDQPSVSTKDKETSRGLVGNRGMDFTLASPDERKWPDGEFGLTCRVGQGYWRLWAEELATLFGCEGQEPWTVEGKRRKIWGLGWGWERWIGSSSGFPPKLSCFEKYGKGEEKLEIYFQVHEEILWRDTCSGREKRQTRFQFGLNPLWLQKEGFPEWSAWGHWDLGEEGWVTPALAAGFLTAGSSLGQHTAPPPPPLPHLPLSKDTGKFMIRILGKKTVSNLSELGTKKLHETNIVKDVSPTPPSLVVLSKSGRRNGKIKTGRVTLPCCGSLLSSGAVFWKWGPPGLRARRGHSRAWLCTTSKASLLFTKLLNCSLPVTSLPNSPWGALGSGGAAHTHV